jgi:FkbM family methyltransferase
VEYARRGAAVAEAVEVDRLAVPVGDERTHHGLWQLVVRKAPLEILGQVGIALDPDDALRAQRPVGLQFLTDVRADVDDGAGPEAAAAEMGGDDHLAAFSQDPRTGTASLRHWSRMHIPLVSWALAARRSARAGRDARRRLMDQYRRFVAPGALVFDVGANAGDHTQIFRSLGASVIAVDPLPQLAEGLRRRFANDPGVQVVERAVARTAGEQATIHIHDSDTISTMSTEWMEAVQRSGRFQAGWTQSATVQTTTLDALIAEHGLPAFCKVDVEGFEPEVFAGLSQPLAAASFEFTLETIDRTEACIGRLDGLGMREFLVVEGSTQPGDIWEDAGATIQRLRSSRGDLPWGDVYARVPVVPPRS